MKRIGILILLIGLPVFALAQQTAEYNKKGDEAMKRLDYSDARMWYEEGVVRCDPYSIDKLTFIWLENKKMRSSMYSLMNKCRNCLEIMANRQDTTAMKQLIVYYSEGIGTPKSATLVDAWHKRIDELRNPAPPMQATKSGRKPMKFFVGYAYSIESPFGLTVGGVKSRFGWYVRFRTNMEFNDFEGECQGSGELVGTLPNDQAYRFIDEQKKNSYSGTVGMLVKCTSWLYTSVGLGYGSRELLYEYATIDNADYRNETRYWAKHLDHSYSGLAVEADVMLKFGPVFLSAGCNTLNFEFVDLNAGIGFFF